MLENYINFEYEELLRQVKAKRSDLYNLASKNDLTSQIVVNCSQELDSLLNEIGKSRKHHQSITALDLFFTEPH